MSAPSEADVSKLDNPAWPKSNQQAKLAKVKSEPSQIHTTHKH